MNSTSAAPPLTTSSESERTALERSVLSYLDGLKGLNVEAALSQWTSDSVQEYPFTVLPVSEVRGLDALRSAVGNIVAAMSRIDFLNIQFLDTGNPDLAYVSFRGEMEVKGADLKYVNQYHILAQGNRGKIQRWVEFYDPRPASLVMGQEGINLRVANDYATHFQKEASDLLVPRIFTPDAEYLVNVPEQLSPETKDAIAWNGLWKGHEGILQFEKTFGRSWNVLSIKAEELVARDEHVVIFGEMHLEAKPTKRVARTKFCIHMKCRDGKVYRYHLFEDTYGVVLSFRKSGYLEIENDERPRTAPPLEQ